MSRPARIAADIGGTFTDVVLEVGEVRTVAKVLTTPDAPEQGVLIGMSQVLAQANVAPEAVTVVVHGTTLATNAIIERRGASTALLTTEGFRDSVEIAQENRFEQYDIFMDRPEPLVARQRRIGIPERISARGDLLIPLDEDAVTDAVRSLVAQGVTSIAVGYLHSYVDANHERRTRELIWAAAPEVSVTLSSDVCPEIREYERFSTAIANAYVQPVMSRYLRALEAAMADMGLTCPLFLMQSNGGLCTLDVAVSQPVRLIESGPAGGAILAGHVANQVGLDRVLSFDMGGTTAKICLIDDGRPQTSRSFEVGRVYRFLKGSGLPLRIPVIELVEIGAGGGSIAHIDALGKVAVGPMSAGSDPGPASYGRGGSQPTVTDADVLLGRLDPSAFAGGTLPLDAARAEEAITRVVGAQLGTDPTIAAFGIGEIVDENMASAARVHAIEQGRDPAGYTIVAFGGAAPLHAARLAEKLGIDRVVVPSQAGVGSAIGFLLAPVAYEVVRTHYQRLSALDVDSCNQMLEDIRQEAAKVVSRAAPGSVTTEVARADMRYVGQGHEITVAVPLPPLGSDAASTLRAAFETGYQNLFTRTLDGLDVEVLTWTVTVSTSTEPVPTPLAAEPRVAGPPRSIRRVFDPGSTTYVDASVWRREDLPPGTSAVGPAIIEEDQTTTVVPPGFTVQTLTDGALCLERTAATLEQLT